ncbi:hypothetical protein TrLO_g1897 [Triparma laevis f. longispina]|uniref:Uncharacterized protein n=1 Tax=Triparma laevis f. longispina TaxID=1714387 RepID=A0A9W7KVE7_9STRA|nr:hypothetical protein TrLO_g1897 [Triparma laevis f. longispina]
MKRENATTPTGRVESGDEASLVVQPVDNGRAKSGDEASLTVQPALTEASSFWIYLAVLATTFHSIVGLLAAVYSLKHSDCQWTLSTYETISTFSLPIVIFLCRFNFRPA